MNDSIARMLERYSPKSASDYVNALREILQEVALLGLWRAKFFHTAAFYGGTALRLLYGLNRFSEDLDFSLLKPNPRFNLMAFARQLEREVAAYGFNVRIEDRKKTEETPIQSAFLKMDTLQELLVIEAAEAIVKQIPRGQQLKIRLEIDTNPPGKFSTETKFLLHPIPFSVRSYVLPDLFAGKMHAVLYRRWKNRVKGRDWYDLVWYVTHHPQLRLTHLAERMIQTGHWVRGEALTSERFLSLADAAIDQLDIKGARREVEPFIKDTLTLDVWSKEFFRDIVRRIQLLV